MAPRVDRRLFGREPSHPDPLLGHTVIFSQESERAVAQLIDPGVADVTERRGDYAPLVMGQGHRDHRRTHTEVVRILASVVQHRDVGFVDGAVESLDGRIPAEAVTNELDRHLRRHFAGRVAAHTVGDDRERAVDVDRVLVRLTH